MAPTTYPTDTLLEDLARQMATSNTRRLSRGSSAHFMPGAMRVAKPSSASNSPRSSLMQARRRTLVNDSLFARRGQQQQQPFDQTRVSVPYVEVAQEEPVKRSTRPVSWHPSSRNVQSNSQSYYTQPYHYSNDTEAFPSFSQYPPTPAGYSGYASPVAAFSPLSLPYSSYDAPAYFSPNPWALGGAVNAHGLPSPEYRGMPSASPSGSSTRQTGTSDEWDAFIANGFERGLVPRTPDSYPGLVKASPTLPSEESIPLCPLVDDEPEGEILVGMGLYDPPEKDTTDPTLQSYRTSVAHLLGSAYKFPEPTGKGLKLEDAWEPPETDEEEDDDESAEKEADEDEDDD